MFNSFYFCNYLCIYYNTCTVLLSERRIPLKFGKNIPKKLAFHEFFGWGVQPSQPPGSYAYGYNGPSFEIVSFFQENVWFSLACAAMVTVKLDVASKAFHRCVSMNPDVSLMF